MGSVSAFKLQSYGAYATRNVRPARSARRGGSRYCSTYCTIVGWEIERWARSQSRKSLAYHWKMADSVIVPVGASIATFRGSLMKSRAA